MSGNLNVFKYGYLSPKYPVNWFHNLRQFFRNIRYAFQRAMKGYCDYDLWDVDTFHTNLIIDGLTDFKKDNNGFPGEFLDLPDGAEKWDSIIDEIILHFRNYRDVDDICINEYEEPWFNRLQELTEYGTDEVSGYLFQRVNEDDFTEDDDVLRKKYYDRCNEICEWRKNELKQGMELFTKWYEHLWW